MKGKKVRRESRQRTYHIHTESPYTLVQPEPHHVVDRFSDFVTVPVQVGLFNAVQVQLRELSVPVYHQKRLLT